MGGSYGGYAALVGLTFTPEIFACGVDLVGISNLVTFLNTIPAYWRPWKSFSGSADRRPHHRRGQGFLEERSPLNRADRIVRPLLIGQGATMCASRLGVRADRRRDADSQDPGDLRLLSDEGHGFVRPENRRSFAAVAEAFLATHLGGRCEPIGDDFEGSTIEFRAAAN